MILIQPSSKTFALERMLWNERLVAMLKMRNNLLVTEFEYQYEIAHKLWIDFCNKNGLEFIPKLLGY